MKTLFETATQSEIKERIAKLQPESPRQWGKMTPAQALAHCSTSLEMAMGTKPSSPRAPIGYVLGPLIKHLLIHKGEPMRRNSPTVPMLIVADNRDLSVERQNLLQSIDRFATTGPAGCTKNAHPFFGKLTPDEWASLMYQHLDHHLRQFQA